MPADTAKDQIAGCRYRTRTLGQGSLGASYSSYPGSEYWLLDAGSELPLAIGGMMSICSSLICWIGDLCSDCCPKRRGGFCELCWPRCCSLMLSRVARHRTGADVDSRLARQSRCRDGLPNPNNDIDDVRFL